MISRFVRHLRSSLWRSHNCLEAWSRPDPSLAETSLVWKRPTPQASFFHLAQTKATTLLSLDLMTVVVKCAAKELVAVNLSGDCIWCLVERRLQSDKLDVTTCQGGRLQCKKANLTLMNVLTGVEEKCTFTPDLLISCCKINYFLRLSPVGARGHPIVSRGTVSATKSASSVKIWANRNVFLMLGKAGNGCLYFVLMALTGSNWEVKR